METNKEAGEGERPVSPPQDNPRRRKPGDKPEKRVHFAELLENRFEELSETMPPRSSGSGVEKPRKTFMGRLLRFVWEL